MSKTIIISDKNIIKSIKFKYPSLMNSNSEDLVKELYNDILKTRSELNTARETVRELESKLEISQKAFNDLENILDIEFETKEIKDNTTKSNIMIKNYGNDFIGKSNY